MSIPSDSYAISFGFDLQRARPSPYKIPRRQTLFCVPNRNPSRQAARFRARFAAGERRRSPPFQVTAPPIFGTSPLPSLARISLTSFLLPCTARSSSPSSCGSRSPRASLKLEAPYQAMPRHLVHRVRLLFPHPQVSSAPPLPLYNAGNARAAPVRAAMARTPTSASRAAQRAQAHVAVFLFIYFISRARQSQPSRSDQIWRPRTRSASRSDRTGTNQSQHAICRAHV